MGWTGAWHPPGSHLPMDQEVNGHHCDVPARIKSCIECVCQSKKSLDPSDLASPAGVSRAQLWGGSKIFHLCVTRLSDDGRA